MVIIHARSWWSGSSAPGALLRGPLSHVVVHHTAGSADFADQAAEEAELQAIDRYHRGQGWAGLGYSFVVFPSGRIYEGRGWGHVGAHTKGHNSSAIGVCLAGNGEREAASPLAWAAVTGLIEQGIRQGHLTSSPRVTGHRNHAATACPGAKNMTHLELLRGITGVGDEREDEDMALTTEDIAAIKDAVTAAVRGVLNEGTGPGQPNWAGTSAAVLDGLQRTFNYSRDSNAVLKRIDAALNPNAETQVLPPGPRS